MFFSRRLVLSILVGIIFISGPFAQAFDVDSLFELPVVVHHELPFPKDCRSRTEVDLRYIKERTEAILAQRSISEDDFAIIVFPESKQATVKASSQAVKDLVIKTLNDVTIYYYSAIQSKNFALQYGNSSEIANILNNIHNPQVPVPLPNGQIIKKKAHADVDISADKRTNSIVVTAPLYVINAVHDTIGSLDRRTTQVMIRVLIAEVTLDEDDAFGIEWTFTDSSFFGDDDAIPTSIVDFGNSSADAQEDLLGLRYSIIKEDKLKAFLHMLKTRSKINVLSSPQLLTSDNTPAFFEETVKVPTVLTTTTSTGVISTSVKYEEIGIKLNVTPQINSDDYIKLEVDQTIQNILASATVLNAPTFSNRVVKTNVLARNNNTVVIGGLLKDNETITEQKVPLLGDLPLIKNLFRRKTKSLEKTELMVFITPQLVKRDKKMDQIVAEMRAPTLKRKLSALPEAYKIVEAPEEAKEFVVVEALKDKVLLSLGRKDGVRVGMEFNVVRPGREYFHPMTNQVVTTEEKQIARVRIESVRESTAIASYASKKRGVLVSEGDLVRAPAEGFSFQDFKMVSIEANLANELDSMQMSGIVTLRNVSGAPVLKTASSESGNTENLRYFMADGEKWLPLRFLSRSRKGDEVNRGVIFFPRWVKANEEVRLKVEFKVRTQAMRLAAERQSKEEDYFSLFNSRWGPQSAFTKMSFVCTYPGKMVLEDFDHPPAVIEGEKSTKLIWTQVGAPLKIKGKYRFVNPDKLLLPKGKHRAVPFGS